MSESESKVLFDQRAKVAERTKSSTALPLWERLWDDWFWDNLEPIEVIKWEILICTKTKQC
jgi:hypothetical protein